ncbi:MAG: hypothetical protein EA402_09730 [Planctomycetota bacterium]|nr:MAG: hypothetical protein EA402_09730 [Planctomycetota bacterium]
MKTLSLTARIPVSGSRKAVATSCSPVVFVLHGLLVLTWLGGILVMGLGVATLGNEEAVLSRERGSALRERRALIERQDQLRAQLATEARRDRLEVAIRNLALPLQAPANSTPSQPRSTRDERAIELARSRQGDARP